MKTLVYHGPRLMSIEEHEEPTAGPDEVILKVESVGICGSEIEGYLGYSSVRVPPLIMGHEFCGTIVDLHNHAGHETDFSLGDKVVVNPLITCGSCDRCVGGKANLCPRRELIGIHRQGAFAEYIKVPRQNLYAVPKETDSSLASLAEPLAVCIHALKLGFRPFEDVLIFGAGTIGLLTLQAARNMGAERVMVVDQQEARLSNAVALGAESIKPEQLGERFHDYFAAQGIDTIIDCVGVTATRQQALQCINPGGKIIMVGLGHEESPILMSRLVRQEVAMIGSYSYTRDDFKQAVQLLVSGKINMDNWAANRSLTEGSDAFQMLTERKSSFSKIILTP
jgi:2-desacetyl-2-hydroxyethyl bacteriochlorophyllide A dehydrogenase